MRTLLVMRHGKSDWDADYEEDHERPLNERGRRSSEVVGRLLAERDLIPKVVISSPAVRALTSAELAAEAGRWDCELILDRRLYGFGPDEVLDAASEAPDVSPLMLVGHEPTWSMLVRRITGRRAEMKTACVAVIDLDLDDWADLPHARGTLREVINPRPHLQSS